MQADELQARFACESAFRAFHRFIDEGVATRAIDLVADDGLFEVRGKAFRGRDEILGFLQRREAASDRHTRHLDSNFCFAMTSASTAEASAQLLIAQRTADGQLEIEAVTDCQVEFALADGGAWLITSRIHRRFAPAVT
ncbi:MAG TPA: nuclear transport factor 2 family protein [Solirubrobacterales bacterium]|jgi:hypothetical protein